VVLYVLVVEDVLREAFDCRDKISECVLLENDHVGCHCVDCQRDRPPLLL